MEAIETYYRENFPYLVKRMARRLDNSEADAKDVVQDAFTRAIMSNSFDEDRGDIGQWFSTILFRSLSDFKRTKSGMSDEDHEIPEDALPVDYEEKALVEDFLLKAGEAVTTEKNRKIYQLYFMEEFSTQDIAFLEGKTDSSVRMAISRLRTLVKNWEKQNELQAVS